MEPNDSATAAMPVRRTYGKPRPAPAMIPAPDEEYTFDRAAPEPDFFPQYSTSFEHSDGVGASAKAYSSSAARFTGHATFASSVRGLMLPDRSESGGPQSAELARRRYDDGGGYRSRFSNVKKGDEVPQAESGDEDDDEEEIDPVEALALLRAGLAGKDKDVLAGMVPEDEPLEFPEDSGEEGDEVGLQCQNKDSHIDLPPTQQNSSPTLYLGRSTESRHAPTEQYALKGRSSDLRRILGGSSDLSSAPPSSLAPAGLGGPAEDEGGEGGHEEEDEEDTAPPIKAGTSRRADWGRAQPRGRHGESSSEESEESEDTVAKKKGRSKGKGKAAKSATELAGSRFEGKTSSRKKVVRSSSPAPPRFISPEMSSSSGKESNDPQVESSTSSPAAVSQNSQADKSSIHSGVKLANAQAKAASRYRASKSSRNQRLMYISSEEDGLTEHKEDAPSSSPAKMVFRSRSSSPLGLVVDDREEPVQPLSEKVKGKMRVVDKNVELEQIGFGVTGRRKAMKGKRRMKGQAEEIGGLSESEDVEKFTGRPEKIKRLTKQQEKEMRSEQSRIRQQKQTHFTGVSSAISVSSFMSDTLAVLKPKREKPLLPLSGALPGLTISAATSVESQLSSLPFLGALPDLIGGRGQRHGDSEAGGDDRRRGDPASDASNLLETPEDDITGFSSATRDSIKVVDLDDDNEDNSLDLEGDSPTALRGSKPVSKSALEFRSVRREAEGTKQAFPVRKNVNLAKRDQENEDLPSLEDVLAVKPTMRKLTLQELKAKRLAEKAASAGKTSRKAGAPAREGIDSGSDSDGFVIERTPLVNRADPKPAKLSSGRPANKAKSETTVMKVRTQPLNPKAKLEHFKPKTNAGSKLNQLHNESVLQNAGKQFNHAGQVQDARHARQAGTKDNKYRAVTTDALNAKLLNDAARQSAAKVAQRHKDNGYRPKELAPKQDITAQIDIDVDFDAGVALAASDSEADDGDDPEDEDFRPDGDVGHTADQPNAEEEMDDTDSLVYSGAEEEPAKPASGIHTDLLEPKDENGKVDGDEGEFEDTELSLRKARRSVRIVTDSDEEAEEETGDSGQSTVQGAGRSGFPDVSAGEDEVDFGDGVFSQLFGATQAQTQDDANGFAGMRLGTADVLARNVMDPLHAQVTASAAQRNAALFEEELNDAAARAVTTGSPGEEPAPRYLNDQGLFTQTRPLARTRSALSGDDSMDDESLPTFAYTVEQTVATALEATYKSISAGSGGVTVASQTQSRSPEKPLRRLKRRRESLVNSLAFDHQEGSRSQIEGGDPTGADIATSSPASLSEDAGISAGPVVRDAFEIIMNRKDTRVKATRAADREAAGEYLQDQAEESEDDEWNFGSNGGQDEEEEADADEYVEGLVDDSKRTKEQIEADAAAGLEKARMDAAADDKELENMHRNAAEGKYRGRRRDGGVGELDWSSDEDEDKRRRPRKARKQVRDLGDDMPAAFKKVYEDDLNASDDDDDVLQEDDESQLAALRRRAFASPPPVVETTRQPAFEIRTETIGHAEIQRQLREVAEQGRRDEREAKRKADDHAERGVPTKRPRLGQAEQMAMDIDTDEEDQDEDSQFSIKRSSQSASFSKMNTTLNDAKYRRHLENDPQAHQDSRKAGGNSSVMGGVRPGPQPLRTNSTPLPRNRGTARKALASLPRTGSLSGVLTKHAGFAR